MSRLITLPDGRQVTGCKNYVLTPKPGLLINERVNVMLALDADARADGARLSVYLRGETNNTATPLAMWVGNSSMGAAARITPDQFKTGYRLDMTKVGTENCPLVLNVAAGEYKLWHAAFMLHNEMDESRITTVYPDGTSVFNAYYP